MPSTTAGPTLTAAAQEGPLGPHSSPQLVPVAQFAPVATAGTSSITCTTAPSPTATATSLYAGSSPGMPTTSLALLAPTTAFAMPTLVSHLKRRMKRYRISLKKSTLTRHVEVPILGRE